VNQTNQPRNKLEQILHKHNRPATVAAVVHAPQCTRVLVLPGRRILASGKPGAATRVSHLHSLSRDIAAELGVSSVTVKTDKTGVWLEIPRSDRKLVLARDLHPTKELSIPIVLGVDTVGNTVNFDLADASTPHVLVAGTTGSGKSVSLHCMIQGLCANTNHMNTQIIVIDTHSRWDRPGTLKDNDGLGVWRNSAHVYKVVTSAHRAWVLLAGATSMVRERYANYSGEVRYIFVIDELADLLSDPEYGDKIQEELIWLLANARKQGVHVIAATQRPSSGVVKGLMKANFPVRIAMTVASAVDSRIILDQSGAERLSGKGDGLVKIGAMTTRFQAGWVDDEDVKGVLRKAASPEKTVVTVKKVEKGSPGLWGKLVKWARGG